MPSSRKTRVKKAGSPRGSTISPPFRDHVGEIALALGAVGKGEREPVTSARLNPDHIHQLELLFERAHSTSAPGIRCKARRARARSQLSVNSVRCRSDHSRTRRYTAGGNVPPQTEPDWMAKMRRRMAGEERRATISKKFELAASKLPKRWRVVV
jgi:hypothetical protein